MTGRHLPRINIVMVLYLVFLMLPIYWLVNMSLKTNTEILGGFSLWPRDLTFANYAKILGDPAWYMGYVNSIIYVSMNTVLSVAVALPAAYAFSRYRFMGDKHLFVLAADQSHRRRQPSLPCRSFSFIRPWGCLIPISRWRWRIRCSTCRWRFGSSRGSCAACPRKSTRPPISTAIPFPRFFVKIFMPLIASGVGVAAFFCFMFSWVELLLSRTLTSVNAKPIAATMTRTVSASGLDWGVLAAAGVLTILPGALVIWFVRNYIAKGFALGRV